ncbi:MAG: NAD(P)-dependent dehydrogenase (short-subunit alcohol dehydrogenase family) [Bradymonadia bacterium]
MHQLAALQAARTNLPRFEVNIVMHAARPVRVVCCPHDPTQPKTKAKAATMSNSQTKHLSSVIDNHTQDMRGKVVAITGTTSGTGYICARELAKLGAQVLLLNRESERSTAALARLQAEVPGGRFEAIVCDLQDFGSVRRAAQHIRDTHTVLDVLCNNAGVMALADRATVDGYDVQMQTNSISPFLLTKELLALLTQSADGRVVNHTSMARLGGPHEPQFFAKTGGDLGGDGTEAENASFQGPRWARYHQSKLANCTFTYGLKAKLEARDSNTVKVMIAHPGLANTSLQVTTAQSGGMSLGGDFMAQAQSAEDGALGIIRACADPQARSGDFYGPEGWTGFPAKLPPEDLLLDPENIHINWAGCEAAVGPFAV